MTLPSFPGWRLIGAFPDGDIPGDVGSWLLCHGGEALLLEVPEGLTVKKVQQAIRRAVVALRYVVASHDHYDHLDPEVWAALSGGYPTAEFLHPETVHSDRLLHIGGEPCWLAKAPKHSATDVVTIFRGVAMTGDIELGMLESVNDEVPEEVRRRSMAHLRDFPKRTGYHVHSIISAHLNDARTGVHWPDLFTFPG